MYSKSAIGTGGAMPNLVVDSFGFDFDVTRCCECLAAKAVLLDGVHASVVDAHNNRQADVRALEQIMIRNLLLVYDAFLRSHLIDPG